jgi:uncharacterized delta-60 repeat protein
MRFHIYFITVWFTCCAPLWAGIQQAWIARHTISAIGTNQAVGMVLDKEGNIIVAGHGTSTNGDFDYVTVKYSTSGTQLWATTFASPTDDQVRSMTLDKDGNSLLTGTSLTVKYDKDGAEKWTAPFGGRGLAVEPSGGVYVTGFSTDTFATVKLQRDEGTNVWLRTEQYIAGRPDISQVIAVDSKSNVFISGQVTCYFDRMGNYMNRRTVAYDANGTVLWRTPAFPDDCRLNFQAKLRGMGIDNDGNAIVSGDIDGQYQPFATVKYNASGGEVWRYSWSGGQPYSTEQEMNIASDGSVYLCGSVHPLPPSPASVYGVIKLTGEGQQSWVARYGDKSTGDHRANAIALDSNSNIYVTGQSPGETSGNDYATIKYDPDGNEKWVQRYNGPGNGDDVATAIAVAPDGSVYVTGWSTTASNLIEITTIKYAQSPGLTLDTNRNAQLQFLGAPGASNRVQATTDFFEWLDLGFSIADTNGCLRFLDTNAPSYPHRFYRMVPP